MSHRYNTARNQSARATRRSSAGAIKVPRISRFPKQHRLCAGCESKFRGCGLREDYQPRLLVSGHKSAVEVRRIVLEHATAIAGDCSSHLLAEILEHKRNAFKRTVGQSLLYLCLGPFEEHLGGGV